MTTPLEIIRNLFELLGALPYAKIALALSLVLVVDHGIRHLKDRRHDWNGRWYCRLALAFLALGLFCHALYLFDQII